ncbi:trypsin-like serine peptidase [Kitasatospora sp. NPDC008050]|uniref:trypsin-like serine peptidase n=1 Tax=Kitasatospora sp. NPDC008050 TaxID=3364021 RepID=UPI0036EA3AC7
MARRTDSRAPLGAALAAALALVAGCGGSPEHGADLRNLRSWSSADWSRWAHQHLLKNEIAEDLWSPAAMKAAGPAPQAAPTPPALPSPQPSGPQSSAPSPSGSQTPGSQSPGSQQPGSHPPGSGSPGSPSAATPSGPDAQNDPLPAPVQARGEQHPYPGDLAVFGKLFAKSPQGTYVCSGTVVSDPQHPGKSNLVWTAGHCLHGGKGADWLKNIAFVPDYNSSGAASDGRAATLAQVAPFGRWWANYAMVSPQWMAEGGDSGGSVNQYDSGIIRVTDPDLPGKSLEEMVGGSVPIWFDAPRERLDAVTAYGFPAGKPFDGQELDSCAGGRPGRLSYDPARPTMLTIGCTMTGGASGGGWLATGPDGRPALVSNTSIGPSPAAWVAGPELDDEAQQMFTTMTELN